MNFWGVEVSVPGRVMLAGEYSVLKGGTALACTLDAEINLRAIKQRTENPKEFKVSSNLWDDEIVLEADSVDQTTATELNEDREPLLGTLQHYFRDYKLYEGFLKVSSQLGVSNSVGLGSALRFGTLCALDSLRAEKTRYDPGDMWDLARSGFELQRLRDANASGYDFATQYLGGLVLMKPIGEHWPGSVSRFSSLVDSAAKYVQIYQLPDNKPELTKLNIDYLSKNELWEHLNQISERLVLSFVDFLTNPQDQLSHKKFIKLVREHRSIFLASPHFPKDISDALLSLPGCDETWSFKTAGSGDERCLLLLGEETKQAQSLLDKLGLKPIEHRLANRALRIRRRMQQV